VPTLERLILRISGKESDRKRWFGVLDLGGDIGRGLGFRAVKRLGEAGRWSGELGQSDGPSEVLKERWERGQGSERPGVNFRRSIRFRTIFACYSSQLGERKVAGHFGGLKAEFRLASRRLALPLPALLLKFLFMVALESTELFGQLNKGEAAALLGIARERTFAAGQEIFKEGDAGDGVYLVKNGSVEISGLLGQNVRRVFSQVAPGEIFGEMAVLEDKPRSACARATEPTTVYFIPRSEMLKQVERSPALSLVLLREISNRLREFNQQHVREVLQYERLAVIGRFARSIVHDLKNPLNIIGITAEMAGMDQATPETRRQSIARIRKQVDRISDLIGEILDFTQGSQSDFVLAPTDYSVFVQQLVEELQPEVALKSAMLELAVPLPAVELRLDPKRLRRVFYNLINNATDAMPEGGKISLRVHRNGTEVVTEIEDSGAGIAPEIAGTLFEVFATHGKAHGTGLGLSICKRIVQDHHGWISARNEAGRGAVFSFGLPVVEKKS
jgi:signal transduction histidine kinase